MPSPSSQPTTPDLFAARRSPATRLEFETCFNAWLTDAARTGGLRRQSSGEVYSAIWNSFAAWCLSQTPPVRLAQVTPDDLGLFLGTRRGTLAPAGDLTDRHTWTVLNLIDRVLRHAAGAAKTDVNGSAAYLIDARPEVKYANAAGTALPDHLPADEARVLVIFLSHVRPRSKAVGSEVLRWQDLRNRASVALQLGAGLAPGDIRAMQLEGVVSAGGPLKDVPWKLRVPADGNTPERETPVARWAGQMLRRWLAARAEHGIPGDWLFPSTKTGKPWSKMAQYRAAQQVLAEAGIDAADGGSFKLRHTFALRQLRRGQSAADVARWMGIARLETLERYSRVLHRPVDVT